MTGNLNCCNFQQLQKLYPMNVPAILSLGLTPPKLFLNFLFFTSVYSCLEFRWFLKTTMTFVSLPPPLNKIRCFLVFSRINSVHNNVVRPYDDDILPPLLRTSLKIFIYSLPPDVTYSPFNRNLSSFLKGRYLCPSFRLILVYGHPPYILHRYRST